MSSKRITRSNNTQPIIDTEEEQFNIKKKTGSNKIKAGGDKTDTTEKAGKQSSSRGKERRKKGDKQKEKEQKKMAPQEDKASKPEDKNDAMEGIDKDKRQGSFSNEEDPNMSASEYRKKAMKEIMEAYFVDFGGDRSMHQYLQDMKIISCKNDKTELTTTFEEGMIQRI